jgi:hypothetical protein
VNSYKVLFDSEPPETVLRLFLDLGVKFHHGVLERVVNLIVVGIPMSDVIILLNGRNNILVVINVIY